jgi:F0F1-type ATP synthase, epsilon subunit (mitochondrial delta subunit)
MEVEIISPTSRLFVGKANSVTVPSMQGPFTMLDHHAPIIAVLEKGKVSVSDENDEIHVFDIASGFVEEHDNSLIICVEL